MADTWGAIYTGRMQTTQGAIGFDDVVGTAENVDDVRTHAPGPGGALPIDEAILRN